MHDTLDFGPTTHVLADLVRGVRDDQLGDPTPCPDYTVADLLDHIGGLALAFTLSARKEDIPGGGNPSADGSKLEEGWRDRIAAQLAELGEAWSDPAAYEGMTQAGPIEMPAEIAALVAIDEVTVHAWDLAVATGQAYDADPAAVEAAHGFAASFEPPEDGPPTTAACSARRSPSRTTLRPSTGCSARPAATPAGAHRLHPVPIRRPEPPPGTFSGGGVSERPKEHASKACVGASPPWVQIPPPPPFAALARTGHGRRSTFPGRLIPLGADLRRPFGCADQRAPGAGARPCAGRSRHVAAPGHQDRGNRRLARLSSVTPEVGEASRDDLVDGAHRHAATAATTCRGV